MRNALLAFPALLLLSGCALGSHPTTLVKPTRPAPSSWRESFARPGPLELESVVSARWTAKRSGLINLEHPTAQAARLKDEDVPIVLPIHVLRHPTAGTFIIDTGICLDMKKGGPGGTRGLVTSQLKELEPVESLSEVLSRQPKPLAGVLLTHMHLDHVLGLPDVPKETPLYAGPGELDARAFLHLFLQGTYGALLEGRGPLRTFDFAAGTAFDVIGDGSLWALASPGHTSGSMAYLANTTKGPVLFVGDTSHTHWGWDYDVEPGTFTADHARNAESLKALKALADSLPKLRIFVGHEL